MTKVFKLGEDELHAPPMVALKCYSFRLLYVQNQKCFIFIIYNEYNHHFTAKVQQSMNISYIIRSHDSRLVQNTRDTISLESGIKGSPDSLI